MKNKKKLKEAINLRERGRSEENQELISKSRKLLFELLEEDKENPEINYHVGVSFDNSGYTRDAIPYYEKAIKNGLNDIDLERCYLGLGSSYRILGRYKEAKIIFEMAVEKYPENRALQIFLSIVYYNLGQNKDSLELALKNLLETSNDEKIKFFYRPLKYYSENLDKTWNPKLFEER